MTRNPEPRTKALSARIRRDLAAELGLEDILKRISQASEPTRGMYFEVPLYLQELLGEVSTRFIETGGSMFDLMVAEVNDSSYDNILYVTLNYDLFLERALGDFYKVRFDDIGKYCPDGREWALIKLHGSVTWGLRLLNGVVLNTDSTFQMTMEGEPQLDNEIIVLDGYMGHKRFTGTAGAFYYPSLAVPLGDKELACPDSHVQTMRKRIEDCSAVLMVGFSALDQHILEHFRVFKNVKSIRIVNETAEKARQTLERCKPYNACFNNLVSGDVIFGDGFDNFAGSDKLRRFLS